MRRNHSVAAFGRAGTLAGLLTVLVGSAMAPAAQVGSTSISLDAALREKNQSISGRVSLSTSQTGQVEVTIEWTDNYGRVADRQVSTVTLPGQTSVTFSMPGSVGLTMLNAIRASGRFPATGDTLSQSSASWELVPDPMDYEDYHANVWGNGTTASPNYFNAIKLANVDLGHIYRSAAFYGPTYNVRPNHDFIEDKRWFEMTDAMHDPNYNIYEPALTSTNDYWLPSKRATLIRPQSLSAESSLAWLTSTITPRMQATRKWRPFQWNIADEYGLGRRDYPFDYDLGPDCIAQFITWLQGQYGTIAALNAQWGTSFAAWSDLSDPINAPRYGQAALIVTQEMKDREYPLYDDPTGAKNFSPWSDFRRHMELTMAAAMLRCVDAARAIDPAVPIGWEGGETVNPLNGYDYWLQMRKMGSFEAYDLSNSPEYARSFRDNQYGARLVRWVTMFNSGSAARNRYKLWFHLIHHGHRGSIIWWYEDFFTDLSTYGLTSYAQGLAPAYGEFQGGLAKVLSQGEHEDHEVALYYSQRSAHAEWMSDSEPYGTTWLRQKSGDRRIRTGLYTQTGWLKALEDVGLKGRFVSYEQVAGGELVTKGYKVLIMPRVVAMSPEEIAAVQAFADAGGVVIADNQTAIFDGHAKRRSIAAGAGLMDGWFGVTRTNYRSTERNKVSSDAYTGAVVLQTPPAGFGPLTQGLPGSVANGWHAVEDGVRVGTGTAVGLFGGNPSQPVLIVRNHGLGKSVYMNLTLMRYGRAGSNYTEDRRYPSSLDAQYVRQLVRNLVALGGVTPKVRVLQGHNAADTAPDAYNLEKARYVDGQTVYLACVINSQLEGYDWSGDANPAGVLFGQPGATNANVTLVLNEPAHVYDVRQKSYLGYGTRINASQPVLEGGLFAVLPYRVTGLTADSLSFDEKRRAAIRVSVQTDGPAPGRHAFRLVVKNPAGQEMTHLTRNVVAQAGVWEDVIPFALSEGLAGGHIVLTDVATGVSVDRLIRPQDVLPGDVDGNGIVEIMDVIDTIDAFGSMPGDPNWNEACDFDLSGIVDIFDVITVVLNFGQSL